MAKVHYPTNKNMLIAVCADDLTVTGFLLTGMGERDKKGNQNFLIASKETTDDELRAVFQGWVENNDIAIIMIAQNQAERVRDLIVAHQNDEKKLLPTIMEIPSKEQPYDPTIDPVLLKAASVLYGVDAGMAMLQAE